MWLPSQAVTGHLLCLLPFTEPKHVTDRLRASYPRLKLTYLSSAPVMSFDADQKFPDEIWKDVTHLCTLMDTPPDPKLAPELGLVHLISAGADYISHRALYTSSSIPITTSNGIHGPTIGEWVMMALLNASRNHAEMARRQAAGVWDNSQAGRAAWGRVRDSVGRRMGILGYGSIGRQVARLARAMGIEVYAYTFSPRPDAASRRDENYVVPGTGDRDGSMPSAWFSGPTKANLHAFLAQDLDFLLLSVPLTPRSRGLIGKEEFEILARKNTFLINVARGEIVDQEELIRQLEAYRDDDAGEGEGEGAEQEGKEKRKRKGIRGAALDVAVPEPLPSGHPLWTAPNCFVSPHMSGVHADYAERAMAVLGENLERQASGRKLLNVVNRETGYTSKA